MKYRFESYLASFIMKTNPFLNKLHDIRYRYGEEAALYFQANPKCSKCSEERLACLTLHHIAGKDKSVFDTLCHNCHALVHAHKMGSYTVHDYVKEMELKRKRRNSLEDRNKNIKAAVLGGMSYRKTAKMFGVSHVTVYFVMR